MRCAAKSGSSRRSSSTARAPRRAWPLPAGRRAGRSTRLSDLAQRRDWLKQARIDHQLVGGWTDVYGYELAGAEGADWARFYNKHMQQDAAALPALSGLATVPLQDGARCAGARRGARCRLQGGDDRDPTQRRRRQLRRSEPRPVLGGGLGAAGRDLSAPALHLEGDDRLDGYDLINVVGRLTDTTIAVARLLFSGHLTRFPGVSLVLSHAGGALPYALGRLKRNQAIHPDYADPEEGFRRLFFDTVMFEPRALRFLCDVAGADKIMLGSDFPFGIGDPDPCGIVDATEAPPRPSAAPSSATMRRGSSRSIAAAGRRMVRCGREPSIGGLDASITERGRGP